MDKYSFGTDEKVSVDVVPGDLYECVKSGVGVCSVSAIRLEKIEN